MRRLGFKLFFAAVMAVSMTSCDSCSDNGGQDGLCSHLKANAAGFKNKMEKQNILQLIDYRSAEEYAKGHIPGAINIPVSNKLLDGSNGNCEYVKLAMENFDTNLPLLVYGADAGFGINGNAVPGQLACKFGEDNVTLLEGGINAWTKAGYPLE